MSRQKAVWGDCQPQPWYNDIFWLHKWARTPTSNPSSVGITVWGYCHIPTDSISMLSNNFYMYNMDAGSSLRWLSASTMIQWHHFDSTSEAEPQNLTQVVWLELFEATAICPWTVYQCAQTLCICLMWMWEAVWYGCQPQQWNNDIMMTPQVSQNPNVWTK
jgi:hypothetical protein